MKDSFWSLAGNFIGRGLALFAGILVARFLGKDIYGEYGMIRNTILTIGVFSTFGLGYTATKYIADFKKNALGKIPLFINYANKITLVFSGFMALLLFVFADRIAGHWLEAEHLSTALRILSVLIVFNAISTTQTGVLSGFGKFKEIARINSVIGVLTFVFSALLTYWYDLNGALGALLLVQVFNCIFNFYIVKTETAFIKANEITEKTLLKEILSFSTPIALRESVYSVSTLCLSIFIIRYSTYGELGLYNAAIYWNNIILFIPGVLKSVILSHLSSSNNKKSFNSTLNQVLILNIVSTLIPSLMILLISDIIENFYGISFKGVGALISISVFITLFSSTSGVFIQSFIPLGKNWTMLLLSVIREIGIFILGYFLISNYLFAGAKSIIIASLVINILFLVIVYFVYKFLQKRDEETSLHN